MSKSYSCVVKYTTLSARVDAPTQTFNFHQTAGAGIASEYQEMAQILVAKLIATPSGATASATSYLGQTVSRATNSATVTVYDITGHEDGSRHGSPIYGLAFTPSTAIVSTVFPSECAVVVTLQATYGSDVEYGPGNTRPRARDRGRIYWGPFVGGQVLAGPNNEGYVQGQVLVNLTKFIKSIADFNTTTLATRTQLCVWSRKDASLKPLDLCWADDEWDTQRRRGNREGARLVQDLP